MPFGANITVAPPKVPSVVPVIAFVVTTFLSADINLILAFGTLAAVAVLLTAVAFAEKIVLKIAVPVEEPSSVTLKVATPPVVVALPVQTVTPDANVVVLYTLLIGSV